MFQGLRNSLLSLAFPQACFICGDIVTSPAEGVSCLKCWIDTRFFKGTELLCGRCGAFLGEQRSENIVYCRQCDDHRYDSASALGVYEKSLAATIIRLKSAPVLPKFLESKISAHLRSKNAGCDLLVPVPLSRRRMLERGHNQAETVARKIGRLTGLHIDSHSLERIVNTQIHRVGMDQKARESTVAKAFDVTRPKVIAGRNILLVDDVMTSGSTASACAHVLKKAGANAVHVFTLARAVYR